MAADFLGKFLNNQNRAKLLRVFSFNASDSFTALQAARRSGLPQKTVAKEIKQLEAIGIVKKGKLVAIARKKGSKQKSAKKEKEQSWNFNPHFKHAAAITKFVYESSPPRYDAVVTSLKRSGRPTAIILSGCFVGDPTRPADLVIAADGINESRLEQAVRRLEPVFGRELRYAAFDTPEFRYRLTIQDRLIRDTLDYPHLVLLDKTRML